MPEIETLTNVESATDAVAARLLQAFMHLRRIHWLQSQAEGLRSSEVRVLFCLKRAVAATDEGIRVSELGNMLNVSNPTITQQLNEMALRGLVEKDADPEDRRAVRIRLTPKGEDAVHTMGQAMLASFANLARYLGEEDSDRLVELLDKAFTYFDEMRLKGSTEE